MNAITPAPARATGTGRASDREPAPGPVALITGCSSGIGRATALRMHAAGYDVYATSRQVADLADLAAAGIRTLRLDVTDEESMVAVIGRITAERGAVSVLVNNAGFELAGPVEEIPLAQARRQFDTNVFGPARLTQLVVPGMRAAGSGTIVNVSSIFGRFAVPGNAYYAASKHAVGILAHGLFSLRRWLPARAFDAFVRTQFPVPAAART